MKNYVKFKSALIESQMFYNLEEYNLKQIDQYIWQLGKDYFPRNYGKKKRETSSCCENSLFSAIHEKENVATANTMLLLSRLYQYSSDKFFRLLKSEIFSDSFEPEIA
ncbi:hypothetical protein KHA80_07540 [Anaerobacillus sp. HL2]|nr:hypothetical protein KHA80_07540 [Anaerobacillus sp. HL2]